VYFKVQFDGSPLCLGISVDKHTDLPSNTASHFFYSNTATFFSPPQTHHHAFK